MKICTSCGQLNTNDADFCVNCGKQSFGSTSEVVCPKCGEVVNGDSVFCVSCGQKLHDEVNAVSNIVDQGGQQQVTNSIIKPIQVNEKPLVDKDVYILENPICPNCRTKLTVNDAFCPACGQIVIHLNQNKLVKRKICEKCGRPNSLDEKYCSYCFSDLNNADTEEFMIDFVEVVRSADKAIKQAVLKSDSGKKYKICPDCGTINDFTEEYCVKCGQKIYTTFMKKYCFVCGAENAYDAKFCVRCQYSFNAKTFGVMQGTWKCECGEINEKENKFCIKCGTKRVTK